MPPVRRRVMSSWLRLRAPGIDFSPALRSWRMTGEEAARSSWLAWALSPRFVTAIVAAFENGRSSCVASVRPGAALRRLTATGVACSAKRRSWIIVLCSSRSAFGNSLNPATMSLRRSAAAVPAVAALRMKPARCWRCSDSGAEDRVAVLGQPGELLVLLRERGEDLVGLLERRVGSPDHRREVGTAGCQARAEVIEDQPEALDLGLAGDVVDEVEVDLLAVVLDRQEVLAGAVLAVRDLLERRRRLGARSARLGGLALDVLLAEERLRADQAGGVAQEVLEARVGDAEDRDGLAGVLVAVALDRLTGQRDRDLVNRADRGARDPHVLAVDEEAGVVEVGANLVAAAVAVLAGGGGGDQRGDDAEGQDYDHDAPHGPGGIQFGLQSDALSPLAGQAGCTKGFEASGAGAEPAPGQRSFCAALTT